MFRQMTWTVALAVALAAAPGLVRATDLTPEEATHGMSAKFWRGLVNVATSWIELPKQIHRETRDTGLPGPFVGLLKGVGMTVYRCVGGAIETATFPMPVPDSYCPLLKPAFVWQDWDMSVAVPKCED